jgi:hypothetical protein
VSFLHNLLYNFPGWLILLIHQPRDNTQGPATSQHPRHPLTLQTTTHPATKARYISPNRRLILNLLRQRSSLRQLLEIVLDGENASGSQISDLVLPVLLPVRYVRRGHHAQWTAGCDGGQDRGVEICLCEPGSSRIRLAPMVSIFSRRG